MSGRSDREARREERVREECTAEAEERRQRLLKLAGAAVFLALVVVVVLIVVARARASGGDASNIEGAAEVNQQLSGIRRTGMVLGEPRRQGEAGRVRRPAVPGLQRLRGRNPAAGDRKPGQKRRSQDRFPQLHDHRRPVEPAGAAAVAAGEQGRGWNFVEIFYKNQGHERSGYVTDEFLTAIAKARRRPGHRQVEQDRKSARVLKEVEDTTAEAEQLGFTGTPSFAVEGPGTAGLKTLGTPESTEALESALSDAR